MTKEVLLNAAVGKNNQTVFTRQLVVIHKGKLVGESYAEGFPQTMPLIGWSMSKSITSALIGVMVQRGLIKDIFAPAVIPEWSAPTDPRRNITIDMLLRMSSGIEFEENYRKYSDATRMLFLTPSTANYFASKQLEAPPDGAWVYSSGSTNLLARIIQDKFQNFRDYFDFVHEFFEKISMKRAIFEPDPSGTFVGSSYVWATARDFAAFGQLYLQNGKWKDEQILPIDWVKYSTTATPLSKGSYGAQWWLPGNVDGFPSDAFFARGYHNQGIAVIPSEDLIMVRLGLDYEKGIERWSDPQLFRQIVKILKKN